MMCRRQVRFRWKDYAHRNKRHTVTLSNEEFLRRFLQHIYGPGDFRASAISASGKLTGSTQIDETGEIETPILLTSTTSVPRVAHAVISYMLSLPGNENVLSINPIVGETNDGYLNDIRGRHITPEDVESAIRSAKNGPVQEGAVGAGIIAAMTTHNPLPSTIGCSWGWTPAGPSTLDPYLEKMAAQGQTFFVASGDDSAWKKSGRNEAWPADDAYIVSVGGTDLITAGAGGAWSSETAWADSGGGISPDKIGIPSWQSGVINSSNQSSTTYRNGPDVAANPNFTFYVCADQTTHRKRVRRH